MRLLGQAVLGEILLSPEMGPLVERWCESRAREVPLHGGPSGRIVVSVAVGTRPQGSRLALQALRPLSRFVGRERELATLCERSPQLEEGRG